jgi:aryl-alcohol dehydrogenase-like predicted oxidoreductase
VVRTDDWRKRYYLGTWQLGGDFFPWTPEARHNFLREAWHLGVRRFDTAAVYGNGAVEEAISCALPPEAFIVTKLPARRLQADEGDAVEVLYPQGWLQSQLEGCLTRLGRTRIETVLLHNWKIGWSTPESAQPLEFLLNAKLQGVIGTVGISLPDGFGSLPPNWVLEKLDAIELPVSQKEGWAYQCLENLRKRGIEVLGRSIFLQGMLVKDQTARDGLDHIDLRRRRYASLELPASQSPVQLLREAWERNISVVVGSTSAEQLRENIAVVCSEE